MEEFARMAGTGHWESYKLNNIRISLGCIRKAIGMINLLSNKDVR